MPKKHAHTKKPASAAAATTTTKPARTRQRSDPIKLESFKMGVLPELIKCDEQVGLYLFQQRNGSPVLKAVSDVLSLSGDEVLFFGITSALAISMSLIRGGEMGRGR